MKLIRAIQRVLELLEQPGALAYVLKTKKPSTASYRICRAISQYERGFGTVLDVGANQGQFALAAAWWFKKAQIYSFEPAPTVVEVLRRNVEASTRITVCPLALGASDGEIPFHVNAYSHASSALPVHPNQLKLKPETAVSSVVSVPMTTLDNWARGKHLTGPLLLKLDVQGLERDVLQGGGTLLGSADYLLVETSFIPLYQGEPLFHEMFDYLRSLKFRMIAPVDTLRDDSGLVIQADLLWKRES